MKEIQNNGKGFHMYAGNAYNTYTENNVGIESKEKLIEILYEGVLRFNAQAKKALKDKNVEKKFYWANRSIAIIVELIETLDMKAQGNISAYLSGLYNYQIQLLSEALVENDTTKIDECTNVFKGLLEAWREATHVA